MAKKTEKHEQTPREEKPMTKMAKQFLAARRTSTPLLEVRTIDPAASIDALCKLTASDTPRIRWDSVSGAHPLNDAGAEALAEAAKPKPPRRTEAIDLESLLHPVNMLHFALELPENTILFFQNAHRHFAADFSVVQAAWNLREPFKSNGRTCVFLAPDVDLPTELVHDVMILDEPLPDPEALAKIVTESVEAAELKTLDKTAVDRSVDALRGLGSFEAEQMTAMSLTNDGIDVDALWEKKRQTINGQKGLAVWMGGETFDDLGGLGQLIAYLMRIINSQKIRPRCVGFVDEIEKDMAGAFDSAAGDSGVSQGQHKMLLTHMQNTNAMGIVLVGPAGTGKSAIAKAVGNAAGVPTIEVDFGGMKGGIVGESEQNLRSALKVISAVSDDRVLWIATCNKIDKLPNELRRRFTMGTWYVDLPTAEERAKIWPIYTKKYGLDPKAERPNDDQWTGAEIKQAAYLAWAFDMPLKESAQYITPVAITGAGDIEKLRRLADRTFLNASKPGFYEHETPETKRDATAETVAGLRRRIKAGEKE